MKTTIKPEVFFSLPNVPIYCNLLWSEQEAAQNCPKGDIELAFNCQTGLISNIAFDSSKLDYDSDYENSLHYSSRFQQYAESLAKDLIERHELKEKNIIEIGCGKGDFLISLAQLGNNRCIGFDPTYVPRQEHEAFAAHVNFVRDYYSTKYREYQANLIYCRHTLEHIPNPTDLLQPLRQAIGERWDTVIFFEVPNSLHTFRNLAVWDIIYEHCCYYVSTSMVEAFLAAGFDVTKVETVFDEQFLCIEAVPSKHDRGLSQLEVETIKAIEQDLITFKVKFQAKVAEWQAKLAQTSQQGKKAVVWGAGSKGVTFLNIIKEQRPIEYVVDINPNKQGKYIAGTGQKIVAPEFLLDYQPDIIVVMNSIYASEIRQMLENMNLFPELITSV